ncbi:MAG: 50S ribosomal protein L11 methyltransferase [Armatimonadota bacterium]
MADHSPDHKGLRHRQAEPTCVRQPGRASRIDYLEIRVTIPEAASEAVEGIMLDAGVLGTSRTAQAPGQALICGYVYSDAAGEQIADALALRFRALDEGLTVGRRPTIERAVVKDADWAEAWKSHLKPVRAGRHFVVKPTWEPFEPAEGDIIIVIDPKMAFGTGSHASTRMCLEVIEKCITPGMHMIDVGCGTGVLAIGAAKLGATATAIDIDPVAVHTCHENLLLNGVADRVTVKQDQGLDAIVEAADIIVANITADAVAALARAASVLLVPGALYVCSGFSDASVAKVTHSLQQAGLTVTDQRREGEWLTLISQKPPS